MYCVALLLLLSSEPPPAPPPAPTALALWMQDHYGTDWEKKSKALQADLDSAKVDERRFQGGVNVAFNSDEAGDKNLFKLRTGGTIQRGNYPQEFRFRVSSDVTYVDRKLREDVSDFLANYDYHPQPRVELYIFAQRFTDSFMSIKQRYEVGTGVRLRFGQSKSLGKPTRPLELLNDEDIARLKNLEKKSKAGPVKAASDLTLAEQKEALDFARSLEQFQHILSEQRAKFLYGFAVSAFKEFEQGEIETKVATLAMPNFETSSTTKRFTLPAEDQYRIVLRPSMRWHPISPLTFDVSVYFKLPISEPYRVRDQFDWRSDADVTAKVKLAGDKEANLEEVSLLLRFEQRFDNVPPRLDDGTVQSELADGRILQDTLAQRTHQIVTLGIETKW